MNNKINQLKSIRDKLSKELGYNPDNMFLEGLYKVISELIEVGTTEEIFDLDDLIIEVHPEHITIYQRNDTGEYGDFDKVLSFKID